MGKVSRNVIIRKRQTASRTPPIADTVAFQRHIGQVGEIVYLWNRVHDNLFQIFWALLDRDDHTATHGIWHSIQSDSTQRQMVEKLANAKLGSRLRAHVLWVCRAHEVLGPYRNAFVHVGFVYDVMEKGYVPMDISARQQAMDRLASAPRAALFKQLRGDLAALDNYSSHLGMRIFYQIERPASPWPERPRLQLVPKKNQRRPKAPNRSTTRAPKRPPSP